MERDERRLADLDRYWDALVSDQPSPRPTGSVADLSGLVDRLHEETGRIPRLFADPHQGWRELRQVAAPNALTWSHAEGVPPSWPNPNGPVVEPMSSRPIVSRRRAPGWVISQLATAALLLLTLAAGYVAVRQQDPERPNESRWTPALVRALESSAGDVVDEVLIEASFTPEQLPAGDTAVIFYQVTLPPGETLSALAGPACRCSNGMTSDGAGTEVVRSGAYRLRLDTPFQVQRDGAAGVETIPAQTEVTLGPGDAAIYPRYAATGEIRGVGDTPAVLVGVAILGMEGAGTRVPSLPVGVRGEKLSESVPSDWETIPAGPVWVTLRQVRLPPGTRIGPYEPVGLEAMRVESGEIHRNYFRPGATDPAGPPLYWVQGRVFPFGATNPGIRLDLTGRDDEPTELLVVIIEPAAITSQTLAP